MGHASPRANQMLSCKSHVEVRRTTRGGDVRCPGGAVLHTSSTQNAYEVAVVLRHVLGDNQQTSTYSSSNHPSDIRAKPSAAYIIKPQNCVPLQSCSCLYPTPSTAATHRHGVRPTRHLPGAPFRDAPRHMAAMPPPPRLKARHPTRRIFNVGPGAPVIITLF